MCRYIFVVFYIFHYVTIIFLRLMVNKDFHYTNKYTPSYASYATFALVSPWATDCKSTLYGRKQTTACTLGIDRNLQQHRAVSLQQRGFLVVINALAIQ